MPFSFSEIYEWTKLVGAKVIVDPPASSAIFSTSELMLRSPSQESHNKKESNEDIAVDSE